MHLQLVRRPVIEGACQGNVGCGCRIHVMNVKLDRFFTPVDEWRFPKFHSNPLFLDFKIAFYRVSSNNNNRLLIVYLVGFWGEHTKFTLFFNILQEE